MRSAAAVPFAVAFLAGCGGRDDDGDDSYPDAAVDAFVAECRKEPNADARTCSCVIDRLEETMPYEEFAAADAALKERREPPAGAVDKLRGAVERCTG